VSCATQLTPTHARAILVVQQNRLRSRAKVRLGFHSYGWVGPSGAGAQALHRRDKNLDGEVFS